MQITIDAQRPDPRQYMLRRSVGREYFEIGGHVVSHYIVDPDGDMIVVIDGHPYVVTAEDVIKAILAEWDDREEAEEVHCEVCGDPATGWFRYVVDDPSFIDNRVVALNKRPVGPRRYACRQHMEGIDDPTSTA